MRFRPIAIGYVRREVSGISQAWDETQIRSLAQRRGYELTKTVVFGPATAQPERRLLNVIQRGAVDAVIVPSAEHLGGDVPAALTRLCDVITVFPENTYVRSELPSTDGD